MSILFEVIILDFPAILRRLRTENQLTQKRLSDLSGVPVITLQNYELANRDPVPHQLIAIADVLHVSLDELVGHVPVSLDVDPLYAQMQNLTDAQREDVAKYMDYVISKR